MTATTTITVHVPTALLTETAWRQEEYSKAGEQFEKCGPTTSSYVAGVQHRALADASRALSGAYVRLAARAAGTPLERPIRAAADAMDQQAQLLEQQAVRLEGR